jgi:hypothetical protein
MTLNREQMVVNMMAARFVSDYLEEEEVNGANDGFSLQIVLEYLDQVQATLPEMSRKTGMPLPGKSTLLAVKRQVAVIVKAILGSY